MTDPLTLLPLWSETLSRVRARMDADVNAGLAPTDPQYVDTREGTFYWDLSQVVALEIARLWDALGSETVAAAFPSTAWGEYLDEHGATFNLFRNAATPATGLVGFTGTTGTLVASGTQVSAPPSDPSLDAIQFITTSSGTITSGPLVLAVQAIDSGSDGNLGAGAITNLDSVVPGISGVSNTAPTSGGTDPESDDDFRARILGQYEAHGAGNIADYKGWALANPGVERATVIPIWNGPGTVLVVVMLADGSATSSAAVTNLQEYLDPVAGLGHGEAPIGATVTVVTTTILSVAITATVTFEPGYSLDGTAGTIPTRLSILDSLNAYLNGLNPGDTIRYQQVLSAFFQTPGVAGVTGPLNVNGGTADIPLSATATLAQTAKLSSGTVIT